MQRGELPEQWQNALPTFPADAKGLATRESSGKVLNAIAERVPWLLGGAADLAPSTKTHLSFDSAGEFQASGNDDYRGRNFHFGVREHAMCAIANGGHLMMPQIVHDITDDQGNTKVAYPPVEIRQAVSASAADHVRNAPDLLLDKEIRVDRVCYNSDSSKQSMICRRVSSARA